MTNRRQKSGCSLGVSSPRMLLLGSASSLSSSSSSSRRGVTFSHEEEVRRAWSLRFCRISESTVEFEGLVTFASRILQGNLAIFTSVALREGRSMPEKRIRRVHVRSLSSITSTEQRARARERVNYLSACWRRAVRARSSRLFRFLPLSLKGAK